MGRSENRNFHLFLLCFAIIIKSSLEGTVHLINFKIVQLYNLSQILLLCVHCPGYISMQRKTEFMFTCAIFNLLGFLHENCQQQYTIFVYLGCQAAFEAHFICTGFGTCIYLYLLIRSSFANPHAIMYFYLCKSIVQYMQ